MTEEEKVASRVAEIMRMEGWKDIVAWMDKRNEINMNAVFNSDEPKMKERLEVRAFRLFARQMETWKAIAEKRREE